MKLFVLVTTFLLSAQFASAAQNSPGPMDANLFVSLSKKLVPSVVNISTFSSMKGQQMIPGAPEDFLRRFFEDMLKRNGRRGDGGGEFNDEETPPPSPHKDPKSRIPRAMSLGSGFVIDASGLILTNNHVVADADEIKLSFTEDPAEKPTDGEVVGRDPELDVALIKVKTKRELIPVVLGDSDATEVGEYVAAIGNPFGQGHSVTHGIISAKGRIAPDFLFATYIQTDAPINPGNSGGPLVNLRGEVIGINNAIEQRAQGIGFAIPINLVKKILPQLKSKGSVSRGYMGVIVHETLPEIAARLKLPKDVTAPIVSQVVAGGPADKAGLKPYDVILEFNRKPIRTQSDLILAVTSIPVGESAPLKILREGKEKSLTVTVTKRPGPDEDRIQKQKKKDKDKKPSQTDTGMELENLSAETAKELGLPPKTGGVIVSDLSYGGAAQQAGLMRGDVIMEIDQKPVKDVESFYSVVKAKKAYLLRVRRVSPSGQEAFIVVMLDLKE
ncbi:MAG: hypothetical protein A2Z97_09770 [Bdellovibrionales bacterium GWB1_52_6]|nr:MAG: hypothetical protein A2Z97_09770 [Bdellovibrionales bacterium GWB1_52_6]OFZ06218.1 MAG: hypothetical protein A2X97_09200 [Bdellovibrionales bacterium GWA1_52_35]HCM41139.1 peptidase [Bdellovibrionales bacterium]